MSAMCSSTTPAHASPRRRRPRDRRGCAPSSPQRSGIALRSSCRRMSAVMLFPLYWMVVVALSSRAELLGGALRLWPRDVHPGQLRAGVRLVPGAHLVRQLGGDRAGRGRSSRWVEPARRIRLRPSAVPWIDRPVPAGALHADDPAPGDHGVAVPSSSPGWASTAATGRSSCPPPPRPSGFPRPPVHPRHPARHDRCRADRRSGPLAGLPSDRAAALQTAARRAVLHEPARTWNDFAWPLIALKKNQLFTLPIGLLYLQGQFGSDYGGAMAFALLNVAPMGSAIFLILRGGCSDAGVRAGERHPLTPGRALGSR